MVIAVRDVPQPWLPTRGLRLWHNWNAVVQDGGTWGLRNLAAPTEVTQYQDTLTPVKTSQGPAYTNVFTGNLQGSFSAAMSGRQFTVMVVAQFNPAGTLDFSLYAEAFQSFTPYSVLSLAVPSGSQSLTFSDSLGVTQQFFGPSLNSVLFFTSDETVPRQSVWLNGVRNSYAGTSTSLPSPANITTLMFGGDRLLLSNLALWDRALTPAEILAATAKVRRRTPSIQARRFALASTGVPTLSGLSFVPVSSSTAQPRVTLTF
jgi:hypothetical protein